MRIGGIIITTENHQDEMIDAAQERAFRRQRIAEDLANNPEFASMIERATDGAFETGRPTSEDTVPTTFTEE